MYFVNCLANLSMRFSCTVKCSTLCIHPNADCRMAPVLDGCTNKADFGKTTFGGGLN